MNIGNGIAVVGMWGAVAACAFAGGHPIAVVLIALFAMIATVNLGDA